jgi:hypothetical protein
LELSDVNANLAKSHIAKAGLSQTDPMLFKQAEALRECNKMLAQSKSWRATMLPTGEGLTMAVRIG